MPLWKIYHPVGAYTPADKQALSAAATALYARFMPAFYVGVIFQEIAEDSMYVGGKPTNRFVRLWIDHIARAFPDAESSRRFITAINQTLEPYTGARGYDWELHIDETPFSLWTIQGYFPPGQGTVDETRWREENAASPRTHD